VLAIVTLGSVLNFLRGGAKLVSSDFVDYTRDALGGPDLQVFGVEIYNEYKSGGEGRTARDVVPQIEAYTVDGDRVVGQRGVWFPDASGAIPSTVTFRPTREKHAVELCGKFPNGADAWLAGEPDPPSLTPGVYEVRVEFLGDNLRPTTHRFYVRNPGVGGRLTAAKKLRDLDPVPSVSSPTVTDATDSTPDNATKRAATGQPEPAPEPELSEPLADPLAEIDALVDEVKNLDRKLWERVKEINRSGGLPVLGTTLLGEVQAWNNRVLRLADEYLPLREAAKVDAIAGWTSIMVSADKVDALLQKNTEVLQRIRRIVEHGRVVEKSGGGES
jgi:hypothetical protein